MNIHETRRLARISQVQLSQKAKISRVRLSAAENGYFQLTPAELRKIQAVIAAETERRLQEVRAALID